MLYKSFTMKKLLFALLILLSFNTVLAQKTNSFDENGKRHGVWKKKFKTGHLRYLGQFNHGKETGTFKYYKNNDSKYPHITKEYNATNDKAIVKFYSRYGVIESTGTMQGKIRIGKWIYYHKDGKTIMVEENYVDGKLHGEYKTYFANKKPTIIANYKNGLLDGSYKRYAVKGHIYQDLQYKEGKLNGKAIYHDRLTGKIKKEGIYKNDLKVGIWKFHVGGEVIEEEQIKRFKKK